MSEATASVKQQACKVATRRIPSGPRGLLCRVLLVGTVFAATCSDVALSSNSVGPASSASAGAQGPTGRLPTGHAPSGTVRQFTVADDIELAAFGYPFNSVNQVVWSPDGRLIAALVERGRLDIDRPEDIVRIYRTSDLRTYLTDSKQAAPPLAKWTLRRSTDKNGPIIGAWRWIRDSSGIAFLERGAEGKSQLMLANVEHRRIEALTAKSANVLSFDIRDREHYVYTVADQAQVRRETSDNGAAAVVGTGRSLADLLFPTKEYSHMALSAGRSQLWAVVGGKPFQVVDRASGKGIALFSEGMRYLALSPDGQSLVTALPVPEIPVKWERLYPPAPGAGANPFRAGKQNLDTFEGSSLVSRFVVIDLHRGTVRELSEGPTTTLEGWYADGSPAWSSDGTMIALPNAFVEPSDQGVARACVAVKTLDAPGLTCLEAIQGLNETSRYGDYLHSIAGIEWDDSRRSTLRISYVNARDSGRGSTKYERSPGGAWLPVTQSANAVQESHGALDVMVKQGLNDPPVLAATNVRTRVSRVIWNPNPQLNQIALGEATVYRWKDKSGRNWRGGLFKPANYEVGRRYPLVIQTHGFYDSDFIPSGLVPSAFAARALAATGILVLQIEDCPIFNSPEEGRCNVTGYEAAVGQLAKEGLVDEGNIGIVGFSRTCFYVMEALTSSNLRIKAASVTDGVTGGYLGYMIGADFVDNAYATEFDAIMGAHPFGEGLQDWLKHSPLFNMDKVTAAVQVVALGRPSLLSMWEPYAAMRYLNKPVDLILINNDEHVLSNPAARLASQGGTVDWFRFWLQDYEDPDPAKAEQYVRWRELRKLQVVQNAERATPGKERSEVR